MLNSFPYTDAVSRLFSRSLLKTFIAKGEIVHDEGFLVLPQCFHLYSINAASLRVSKVLNIIVYKTSKENKGIRQNK